MIYLLITMILLFSGCISSVQKPSTKTSENLKVLTINLCADWNAPRKDRADKIIDLVKSENVDIILTQEGIKGIGQFDMVKYIAEQLGYSYVQSPSFGIPGFLEYCVGIISNSPIYDYKVVGCQVSGGDPIDKIPFPGSGRGILANINGVAVMSSHLTVPVEQSEKEKQIQCLMKSIPEGIAIWGGDFNFTRNDMAYPLIKMQEAVYPGNPQVDMIFYKGFRLLSSKTVFEDHYVSDHVGILTEFSNGGDL